LEPRHTKQKNNPTGNINRLVDLIYTISYSDEPLKDEDYLHLKQGQRNEHKNIARMGLMQIFKPSRMGKQKTMCVPFVLI